MTTIFEAQQIGRKYAVQAALVTELAIGCLALTFLLSSTGSLSFLGGIFEWIGLPTFSVFILSTLLFSYLLGQKLAVNILTKGRKSYWRCYTTAIAVVLLSTGVASSFTLANQLIWHSLPENWLILYVAKPIVWMVPLSILPVLMAGTWYQSKL
ncbi:hypothetical protein [Tunicatimonas pelagia]|uniref:hypothetical protein n=1 Tax=Tunicatimonas pelagia TaxID=931531 RepID=UPI002666101D|nr:hypothetical protein [Tunicatimonas pelagia]WKN44355.1 hypothetical protein P0M28_05175 [Tunicatimonas pelagia]